mmetsp:Transcript_27900/g.73056  ORF Transcript_27900/g.73056 Transcript_27900/m.73056 type:complete len:363 (+) Transcript_27900:133-1221(+)
MVSGVGDSKKRRHYDAIEKERKREVDFALSIRRASGHEDVCRRARGDPGVRAANIAQASHLILHHEANAGNHNAQQGRLDDDGKVAGGYRTWLQRRRPRTGPRGTLWRLLPELAHGRASFDRDPVGRVPWASALSRRRPERYAISVPAVIEAMSSKAHQYELEILPVPRDQGEVVHAHVRATRCVGHALDDCETNLTPRLVAVVLAHASASDHEADGVRGPSGLLHHAVAVHVALKIQETHLWPVTSRHLLHPVEHCWHLHAVQAAGVLGAPVPQKQQRPHGRRLACVGAELQGVRLGQRPRVRARVPEEGRVADVGAEDEILRRGDLRCVWVAGEVVRGICSCRHCVLSIKLHEAVSQLVV